MKVNNVTFHLVLERILRITQFPPVEISVLTILALLDDSLNRGEDHE
jgi:hypothetical protein